MSQPRDWDAEEREALDGLDGELAEIRRRHQDDPSLEMLRAAEADALPPEIKARVTRHLQDSAWSRAVVDGLRETGADDHLDAASEDRLFERITRKAQATPSRAPSRRRWSPAIAIGGLALAATLLIAVVVQRSGPDTVVPPDGASASIGVKPPIVDSVPTIRHALPSRNPRSSSVRRRWRGAVMRPPTHLCGIWLRQSTRIGRAIIRARSRRSIGCRPCIPDRSKCPSTWA